MKKRNGEPRAQDILALQERSGLKVVEAEAAPITNFKHERGSRQDVRNQQINPHVTKLTLEDGRVSYVTHQKPVYYMQKDTSEWRPMEEVTHENGKSHMRLKADWADKIHPRFFRWMEKRMELINKGRTDDLKETDGNGKVLKRIKRGIMVRKGNIDIKLTKAEKDAVLDKLKRTRRAARISALRSRRNG